MERFDLREHWFGLFTRSIRKAFFSTSNVKTVTAWLFVCELFFWILQVSYHIFGSCPQWIRQAEPLPTFLLCAEVVLLTLVGFGLTYNKAIFIAVFTIFQMIMTSSIVGMLVDRIYLSRIFDLPPLCVFTLISFLIYTSFTGLKCYYYFETLASDQPEKKKKRRDSIMAYDMSLSAFGTPPMIEKKRGGIDYLSITAESIFTDYGDEILV